MITKISIFKFLLTLFISEPNSFNLLLLCLDVIVSLNEFKLLEEYEELLFILDADDDPFSLDARLSALLVFNDLFTRSLSDLFENAFENFERLCFVFCSVLAKKPELGGDVLLVSIYFFLSIIHSSVAFSFCLF